jgi:hypothetical protein
MLYHFPENVVGSSSAPAFEPTGLAGIGVSTGAESEREKISAV